MIYNKIKNTLYKFLNHGSITRCTLDPILVPILKKMNSDSKILDVGGKYSPYKKYMKSKDIKILDIMEDYKPDYCCDIHDMRIIPDESFDVVLATEVLEHCYAPHLVVDEIRRVLKRGGACILTTRFIHPIHSDPHDYFRFTCEGLKHLFRNYSEVEVQCHGNRLHVICKTLMFFPLNILIYPLNPIISKVIVGKTNYALGYVVYAKK